MAGCVEEDLDCRRRVAWAATWCALAIDVVILLCVWAGFYWDSGRLGNEIPSEQPAANAQEQRSYSSPVGWAAAAGAAIIFGTSELPIKIPESQDIGPALFNAYSFFGNGLCHSLFLLLLLSTGKPLMWQWEAVGATLNIALVQAFARSAIWLLGISVAPPMWCVVGMATSFAWGTLIFGDKPGNLSLSLIGLFLLMTGVTGVSSASVLSHTDVTEVSKQEAGSTTDATGRSGTSEDIALTSVVGRSHGDREDTLEVEDANPNSSSLKVVDQKEERHCNALFRGFLYALGAGVADGSLVAFYQQTERTSKASMTSETQALYAIFCYLGTFGVAMLAVSSLLIVVLNVMSRVKKTSVTTSMSACTLQKTVPGIISGSMWAGANSCSVLASHFLGMSLSFPLTQTASVICALLGLVVFNELQGVRARAVFSLALMVIVIGAIFLAVFGKPDAQS